MMRFISLPSESCCAQKCHGHGSTRDEAQDLAGRLVGYLYLGLADNIVTLPKARVDAAIVRFYQREHDMHLRIFVNSPTELEMAVIDGQLGMAIGIQPMLTGCGGLSHTLFMGWVWYHCCLWAFVARTILRFDFILSAEY
jgi:hypothetical protein